jgi:hypothetical protein
VRQTYLLENFILVSLRHDSQFDVSGVFEIYSLAKDWNSQGHERMFMALVSSWKLLSRFVVGILNVAMSQWLWLFSVFTKIPLVGTSTNRTNKVSRAMSGTLYTQQGFRSLATIDNDRT